MKTPEEINELIKTGQAAKRYEELEFEHWQHLSDRLTEVFESVEWVAFEEAILEAKDFGISADSIKQMFIDRASIRTELD